MSTRTKDPEARAGLIARRDELEQGLAAARARQADLTDIVAAVRLVGGDTAPYRLDLIETRAEIEELALAILAARGFLSTSEEETDE